MAHSKRKTPICGNTTARSNKAFKTIEHRRARAATRAAIISDAEVMPHDKETGSPWASPKDGKQWFGKRHPKLMRK